MTDAKKGIPSVVNKIKKIGGKNIKFIILYGSIVKGNQTPLSDIDLAVYYEGTKEERFKFRMEALGNVNDKFDIQIFQDLPLYVRKEIISHGEILYQKNYSEIFDIFIKTIKSFGDFKPRLDIYYSGLEV
jgi:predicted nucleotidyltransferase